MYDHNMSLYIEFTCLANLDEHGNLCKDGTLRQITFRHGARSVPRSMGELMLPFEPKKGDILILEAMGQDIVLRMNRNMWLGPHSTCGNEEYGELTIQFDLVETGDDNELRESLILEEDEWEEYRDSSWHIEDNQARG